MNYLKKGKKRRRGKKRKTGVRKLGEAGEEMWRLREGSDYMLA